MRVKTMLLVASFLCLSNGYSVHAESGEASMISLISVPERFNNKMISTEGIAVIQSGLLGCFLYLTRFDAEHQVYENAILLSPEESDIQKFKDLNGQMVFLQGTFHNVDSGTSPNGYIDHITDMVLHSKLEMRPPFGQLPALK